jgi:transcription elongation factor Elf1
MPAPIVNDYEILAGVFSKNPTWNSTLSFSCPHCNAKLKSQYVDSHHLDDCAVCGKEFLISSTRLAAAINSFNAEKESETRKAEQYFQSKSAQRQQERERKLAEMSSPKMIEKRERDKNAFYNGIGCLMLIGFLLGLMFVIGVFVEYLGNSKPKSEYTSAPSEEQKQTAELRRQTRLLQDQKLQLTMISVVIFALLHHFSKARQ